MSMEAKSIILDNLSSGPLYLAEIHEKNPNVPLDDFQTAAWVMVHKGEVDLGKDWKLSIAA